MPPAAEAGGFALRPPLASGSWGLRPQTPKTAPPLRISGYAFVKRAVKLTTPPSRRIAGSKKLTGEAVCPIAGRKKQWIGKNTTSQEKLLMLVNKIKAIIAIGIALIAFFL